MCRLPCVYGALVGGVDPRLFDCQALPRVVVAYPLVGGPRSQGGFLWDPRDPGAGGVPLWMVSFAVQNLFSFM